MTHVCKCCGVLGRALEFETLVHFVGRGLAVEIVCLSCAEWSKEVAREHDRRALEIVRRWCNP